MTKKREPKVKYNSQEEAALAKAQYEQLLIHPAWLRIVKYYQRKIAFHNDELLSKDITSLDQLERIRDKIRLCTQMMNLPDIMIANIDLNVEEEKISFDPFA